MCENVDLDGLVVLCMSIKTLSGEPEYYIGVAVEA